MSTLFTVIWKTVWSAQNEFWSLIAWLLALLVYVTLGELFNFCLKFHIYKMGITTISTSGEIVRRKRSTLTISWYQLDLIKISYYYFYLFMIHVTFLVRKQALKHISKINTHACMHEWVSGCMTKSAGVISISYLVLSHHSYSGFDNAYQKFSHRLVLLNPASKNKDHLFRCSWKRSPEAMDLISSLINKELRIIV